MDGGGSRPRCQEDLTALKGHRVREWRGLDCAVARVCHCSRLASTPRFWQSNGHVSRHEWSAAEFDRLRFPSRSRSQFHACAKPLPEQSSWSGLRRAGNYDGRAVGGTKPRPPQWGPHDHGHWGQSPGPESAVRLPARDERSRRSGRSFLPSPDQGHSRTPRAIDVDAEPSPKAGASHPSQVTSSLSKIAFRKDEPKALRLDPSR